jgi:hypothetical protein
MGFEDHHVDLAFDRSAGHRPGSRRRSGSPASTVGDEAGQGFAVAAELKAQRAAQPQVVIEMIGQRGHDVATNGQGRAMARSRSTSTRA